MSGICKALIGRGKKKGETCGRKVINDRDTCGFHANSVSAIPKIERYAVNYQSLRRDLDPYIFMDVNIEKNVNFSEIASKHHLSLREILNILMYDECNLKAYIVSGLLEEHLVFCEKEPVNRYYAWIQDECLWIQKDISLLCRDVYKLFQLLLIVMKTSDDMLMVEQASIFKSDMKLSRMKEISIWVSDIMKPDLAFKSKIDSSGMFCFDRKIIDITSYNPDIGLPSILRDRKKSDLRTFSSDFNLPSRSDVDFTKIRKFMQDITLDNESRMKSLLMILGSSLLGENKWQKLYICVGETSNGKSTLFNLMQQILEDSYHQASPEVFLYARDSDAGSAKSHLASLENKLLVALSETKENINLNESQIKSFTGADMINGRKLNKEESPFKGKFTPFILSNFMPNISCDKAMKRRVVTIEFPCSFVINAEKSNERRMNINYKFDQNDRHAMFYLLIDGIIDGINLDEIKVDKVVKTDKDIQMDEFLSDCFIEDEKSREASSVVYTRYKSWCIDSSSKELFDMYSLGRQLASRYEKIKTNGGVMHYIGIKINDRN